MKKTIVIILALLAVSIGAYAYITRPVPDPSVYINDEIPNRVNTVETNDTPQSKVSGDVEIRTINMGIIPAESKAEFRLNEILRGVPTVVVGSTNSLTGDVSVTFAPANIALGEMRINARTLKTDSTQRDGAISRLILKSDQVQNEFITLKNAVVTNLPTVIPINQNFTFTVVGDMTIAGATKKVSFTGSGSVSANNSFTGNVNTIIKHSDFNLKIPDFPFLADVDDQSQINISFVAR